MAESTLNVFMDGIPTGQLHQTRTGDLRFRYDPGYRANPHATPLSLSMPLLVEEHRKRAVLPFFDGLLTDSFQARQALATRYRTTAASTFRLLEAIGADVAGALQILPPGESCTDTPGPDNQVGAVSEAELGELLRTVVAEYRDGRPSDASFGRFSLAGAQPKIALTSLNGAWGIPHGAVPTTHIFKPSLGGFNRLDLVEHMTMRAAAHLDLEVSTTEIHLIDEIPCLVTTRYDRSFDGTRWHRLHQEDLTQALSVMSDKKYQHDDGGPGVGAIAQLLRALPLAEDRLPVAQAFYCALVFNVLARCTDAHAKNYSLLLNEQSVRLAPLYDLATIAPHATPREPTYSAMRIGDHHRFSSISLADFLMTARTLGLDTDWASQIVTRFRAQLPGAFESARDDVARTSPDSLTDATAVLTAVTSWIPVPLA
ncbi:MAG: HipA domain-containing protein [Propionibacteriaceae bacterium]|jgi:serine/threonine-protein kinase HipA|nr:HipA domain-containing protein [Propionibacteriaceae bacterium]